MTATRICTVDACTDEHAAKGYCQKHYARWRRTGDPEGTYTAPIPTNQLHYLRNLVGLPAEGPTNDMLQRWLDQENDDTRLAEAS
ncbi:hypothetical protein [Amycolatopsis thermoflava]|uniref:hypothetical protein n=1 Tax=Amycolatopsis thermoflava TaxID=84480 RepID=UPI00042582FA|nr:hypothetical protein [Amycolatopsis thermoflava]